MTAVGRVGSATLASLLLASLLAGRAAAETRTVEGGRLVLADTLSDAVAIDTDPSLSGAVRLSAEDSLSCLQVASGHDAEVGTGGCHDLAGLRVTVPPDMPVTVTGNGDGGLRVGDLRGTLILAINDDFDVKAGRLGGLVLTGHGSGDVVVGEVAGQTSAEGTGSGNLRIGRQRGPLSIQRRGSGDVTVGAIEAPAVSVDTAGSGDVVIGGGAISALRAHLVGSGDLSVAAGITTADVTAVGGGDVKLTRVSGSLRRSASGGSDITVGGAPVEAEVMSRVVRSDGSGRTRSTGHHSLLDPTHAIMAVVVLVGAFLVWRMVRRGRAARAGAADAPMHPGVQAVCETMARLDQRLGRLEGYVTTREFDLNRKFRELGR